MNPSLLTRLIEWFLSLFAKPTGQITPAPIPIPTPDSIEPLPVPDDGRIIFPSGMIQTRMPNGALAIPWSQVERWESLFRRVVKAGGYNYHPLLLLLFSVVESRSNQYVTGQMTGTRDQVVPGKGDPRSKGLLQIRLDLHMPNPPGIYDGYTPEGNVRLGAMLLDRWMKSEGSWEAALENKWHPGTDPASGVTREEYIRFIREAIAEVKATWPTTPATPPLPGKANPFRKPVIYDLATDYARFSLEKAPLTEAMAQKIIHNRFENREGKTPRYIINHIQDGTTPGSLNWWAVGAGVQASSTVIVNRDGSLLKVVPEQHGPWTNGIVCNPTEKSAALRAMGGNPNLYSLTIEAEGRPGVSAVSYTPEQLETICWQMAEWIIARDIPLANVLSHATIDQCDRPTCPGEANQLAVLDKLKKAGFA